MTILCVSVDIVNTNGECIAFEVLKYREKREKGAFASSTKPRTNRSKPEIKYRIGQVIKHKRWGYRAVIVGWDQQANAPEEWIKQVLNHMIMQLFYQKYTYRPFVILLNRCIMVILNIEVNQIIGM